MTDLPSASESACLTKITRKKMVQRLQILTTTNEREERLNRGKVNDVSDK